MNHIAAHIAKHTTYQARKLEHCDSFGALCKVYSLDNQNLDALAKSFNITRKDLDTYMNVLRKFLNV